jgi:rhomboid protease GluP
MPEKSQSITVSGYEAAAIQRLAYGVFLELGWTIKYAGDNILLAYTNRKWNKWNDEITIATCDNELTITSKMIHGESFDMMGRNKKHIAEFLAAFDIVKTKATTDNTHEWNDKINLLKSDTIQEAEKEIQQAEEVDRVMNLSGGNMYVTYGIIAINVLVFVAMAISGVNLFAPLTLDILKWGGNYPALTFGGEWWRLLTCMFVHIGILHLVLNMYALYFVSAYLEPMLGKTRYIAAYLCAGLLSSLVSLLWHKDADITSAGASGAIFGMYGVFLALLTTNVIPRHVRKGILQSILIFVGYNIFNGFKPHSGIDNAAHLGGLISGLLIGYLYYFSFKNPSAKKTQTITSLAGLVTIIILFSVLRNERTSSKTIDYKTGNIYETSGMAFEKMMQKFAGYEEKGTAYETDTAASPNQLEQEIRQNAIPAWEQAGVLAVQLNEIAKTGEQKQKATMLNEYVDIRKRLTALNLKTVQENTHQYDAEMSELINRINKLLQEK